MRSFYFVIYDDRKLFDVIGPIADDTDLTYSVVEKQKRGFQIHCGTVMSSQVRSISELKKDNDPPGYKYCDGLFGELGI